ncbi:hypothetical protein V8C34DRAFT_283000 [Trichoderma compactum]
MIQGTFFFIHLFFFFFPRICVCFLLFHDEISSEAVYDITDYIITISTLYCLMESFPYFIVSYWLHIMNNVLTYGIHRM